MLGKFRLLFKYCRTFGVLKGLRTFVTLNTGNGGIVKPLGEEFPMLMRRDTSDIKVFHQVFLFNEYDIAFPKSPKVIIDGGANIGLFAVRMKNEFKEAKVICIEPDGSNFEVLRMNVASLGNVECENVGLWDKDAKLRVFDKFGKGKWGMCVEEDQVNGTVSAMSIGSLIRKYGIDRINVLKLDIEGSEKQLFTQGYEEWLPLVDMIVVELHDGMEPGSSRAFFSAITKCFHKYRYSVSGENTIIWNLDNR